MTGSQICLMAANVIKRNIRRDLSSFGHVQEETVEYCRKIALDDARDHKENGKDFEVGWEKAARGRKQSRGKEVQI